jgi:aminodeoxyfutalosine deaminase
LTSRRDWLRDLPKAELHVHLEGTITPSAYARIARRNGVEAPENVASIFSFTDFQSFLVAFISVVRALREPEDLAEIATEYLRSVASHGVLHVEFFFSPATIRQFTPKADLPGMVQAIHAAARAEEKKTGISTLISFDLVRNLGEEAALADIDLAQRCAQWGVAGVGLGGDERNFPARDFFKPFDRAKRLGLRRTVHAGEAAGPESVRDAIEILDAERIGHGVAAVHDHALLDAIVARGIAIDSCPTSNRLTGAVAPDAAHPIHEFLKRGVKVTLGSDDPSYFGAGLLDEYDRAMDEGLSREQIVTVARNSLMTAFARDDRKQKWLEKLEAYLRDERRE